MSNENKNRRVADERPTEEDVLAKVGDEEALTLEELEVINRPPARLHNDDADIGKRYEGSNYAPAAQPDLNAPAYVLERQAKLAAEGKDDTRVGIGEGLVFNRTDEEKEEAAEKQERREDAAAKKAAAKKA